jgi:hypothetical protein
LQAAEKDAADASTKRSHDEGAASLNANQVLMLHSRLKIIQARAAQANKAALEEEKERDELHTHIEEIEEQLQPKRARSDADVGDTHEICAEVDNWDLRDHRREGTRVQNRRNVQVGSRDNQQKPRPGKDGFLLHTRLGLVGWIAYWCYGDAALAVVILVALINTLGLTELVSDALASRKQKEAETNAKIVDLFKEALDEIKNCRTEQQRVEFHIALACVMPPREAEGSKNGWIRPICDRLGLKRGKRSEKNGARPYASEQAVENRAIFNKDRELLAQPVKVGDMVLSKGQLCESTITKSADHQHPLSFLHARASCHVFLLCFLVYRGTMRGGRSAVGARHARVCVAEDTDPSPVDRISWWKVVRAPSRPFGQKTNLLSQHQQGFGIVT